MVDLDKAIPIRPYGTGIAFCQNLGRTADDCNSVYGG